MRLVRWERNGSCGAFHLVKLPDVGNGHWDSVVLGTIVFQPYASVTRARPRRELIPVVGGVRGAGAMLLQTETSGSPDLFQKLLGHIQRSVWKVPTGMYQGDSDGTERSIGDATLSSGERWPPALMCCQELLGDLIRGGLHQAEYGGVLRQLGAVGKGPGERGGGMRSRTSGESTSPPPLRITVTYIYDIERGVVQHVHDFVAQLLHHRLRALLREGDR